VAGLQTRGVLFLTVDLCKIPVLKTKSSRLGPPALGRRRELFARPGTLV
jgi:hypothetical protein